MLKYKKISKAFKGYCPSSFENYLEELGPLLSPYLARFALGYHDGDPESFSKRKITDKFDASAPDSFDNGSESFSKRNITDKFDASAPDSFYNEDESFASRYLYSPLSKYLKNPGKMHRPLTCIAAFFACGGKVDSAVFDKVIDIALSLELFQSAALLHDDIADEGDLRRGEPCMHRVEGEAIALNAGDFALSAVEGQLIADWQQFDSTCADATIDSSSTDSKTQSPLDSKMMLRILHEISQMQYRTIEGQAIDLGWARDGVFNIKVDDYIDMARRKTAYYSAAVPCVLGAICAGADNSTVEHLRNFGLKVGLSFQIRDDLLNLVGSDKSKDFRSDIVEGKRTLLVAYTLEHADCPDAVELCGILGADTNSDTELARAVEIMNNCGAIEYAQQKSRLLADEALDSIAEVLPKNSWSELLLEMAKWSCNRKN